MSPFGSIYIIKKHVSCLTFQDKINGSNLITKQEEHVGPGGQVHQGQDNAHHAAGIAKYSIPRLLRHDIYWNHQFLVKILILKKHDNFQPFLSKLLQPSFLSESILCMSKRHFN